ncbi:hypothetical protein KFK09_017202 [Dendrobium nobile]|uniref:Uncharacterized protein n=1 Tax=Dendrobium nobile TaxID=94219 RepID=A0A8T3B6S1_DENNO|nr:hypothetical protein KFK09_017202 [Dendrobium nobile]
MQDFCHQFPEPGIEVVQQSALLNYQLLGGVFLLVVGTILHIKESDEDLLIFKQNDKDSLRDFVAKFNKVSHEVTDKDKSLAEIALIFRVKARKSYILDSIKPFEQHRAPR